MPQTQQNDPFLQQTADLRALGGQRVWSLMISLFGDLAQAEGQSIDGPLLSSIMHRLAIKPEATRVALHRLRKEGWVQSDKAGRISHHSLTAEGRAQSAAASPRIYADPQAMAQRWQLVLLAPDTDEAALHATGFAMITPRVCLGPLSETPPKGALALPGNNVPAWLRAEAEPATLSESYADLLHTLRALESALPEGTALEPLDTAVLRCLVVHNWRRLVLKHPILPAPLINPDWAGHQCHLAVWDLLRRFPRPSLAALSNHRAAA